MFHSYVTVYCLLEGMCTFITRGVANANCLVLIHPGKKKNTCWQVYMGGHVWPIYDPTATYKAPCFSFGVSSGKKNNRGKSKSSRNASVFVLMRLVTKALRLCAASRRVVSTGCFFFQLRVVPQHPSMLKSSWVAHAVWSVLVKCQWSFEKHVVWIGC